MFEPVNSRVDFPKMERDTIDWWNANDIPLKYRRRNEGAKRTYSFIDGPITANNPMGVHHAWGRSYKDLFLRFRNMQGYRQRFQNGYDGQGLWIEVEVEKELGFASKRDIEGFGVGKFVDMCKARVDHFADIITEQSKRLGYWMDWEDSYHTKSDENNYMIWHFLKTCHEKGLIYKGTDVMPWCPRCSTGLSEHEIVTEGYVEIVHPGLFVEFPLLDRDGESLLIWTTTPWTLSSNVAAAVHPELAYARVRNGERTLYLAKARLSVLRGEYETLDEMPGSDLVGLRYRGPFDELPAQQGVEHKVLAWDEVSESDGTGIVHTAPGAGKEDFALGKENGLAVIAPLDDEGEFVEGFGWLTGMSVFDVNEPIYDSLRAKGVFYRVEPYSHRYPVCWRCGTELVFRLVDEWFIRMEPVRDLLMRVTENIEWVPAFGKARELDWLRNMDDWMISKKRYYGLALPIFECGECGEFEIIGSEHELRERAVEGWDEFEGNSPHRPWVDAVKIECAKCGVAVSRIQDVGNPWLDAGIVSFSTLKYREDRDYWNEWFPADWISESFPGQFRNWFYSLLTMGAILRETEAFELVFSYALMRDEDGEEMHKSKGTAIWFEDAAENMGVDAMRWTFARHTPENNINFGFGTADEVRRRFIIPLWNVYSFFVTYANIDRFDPSIEAPPSSERPDLDRWIISELNQLIADMTAALERFEPETASRRAEEFVHSLSNWYVRRSRRRFWKSGLLNGSDERASADVSDKLAAYATLYEVLVALSKLLAPMMPFVTDVMHRNLAGGDSRESVHLEDYPTADMSLVDSRLNDATRLAQRVSSMGRAARSKAQIKVRQPLERVLVRLRSADEREALDIATPQILDELNVRGLEIVKSDADIVQYEVRPNMRLLGPKHGRRVGAARQALATVDAMEAAAAKAAARPVSAGGFEFEPDELLVSTREREGLSASTDAGYAVAVTTLITRELSLEGAARELVHRIQNMRRDAGFDIADHIVTHFVSDDLGDLLEAHGGYVMQETLSVELISAPPPAGAHVAEQSFDGLEATIGLTLAR